MKSYISMFVHCIQIVDSMISNCQSFDHITSIFYSENNHKSTLKSY